MSIPDYIQKYFWEVDINKLDPERSPEYVIARILEHGDIKAVRWLLKNFEVGMIKKVIMERRGFSERTANFWRLFFNLDKNKILCLRKSYQTAHAHPWPY